MSEPNNHILQKIRNLLRRANEGSGASLHEALSCAEIAQRLMDQYKIDRALAESDLFGSAPSVKESIIDYVREYKRPFSSIINPPDWVKSLFSIIALANDCEVYIANFEDFDTGKSRRYSAFSIIGRYSDIQIVQEFCSFLLLEIVRIGAVEGEDKDGAWLNDFYFGAVKQIQEKFNALKERNKNLSEDQKFALSIIENKRKEINDFIKSLGDKFEEEKTAKAADGIAVARGYKAAESISLEKKKVLNHVPIKRISQ